MSDVNLLEDNIDIEASANQNAPAESANVPAKFWDADKKEVRVDALLQSYLQLEKKMSGMVDGADKNKLQKALGVPNAPQDYAIACDHGLFQPSDDINTKLHDQGFTQDQAQLVYNLAAEHLVPMIVDVAAEFQAAREQERLVEAFGGQDKWSEVSKQMLAWGKKNLPDGALAGLAASFEGVMALYKMMQSGDPITIRQNGASNAMNEKDLHSMMQDPRYWRDRDPSVVQKVTDGFKRLYTN